VGWHRKKHCEADHGSTPFIQTSTTTMSLPSADELEQLEEIGANFRSIDFGQKEKCNQFERFTKKSRNKIHASPTL